MSPEKPPMYEQTANCLADRDTYNLPLPPGCAPDRCSAPCRNTRGIPGDYNDKSGVIPRSACEQVRKWNEACRAYEERLVAAEAARKALGSQALEAASAEVTPPPSLSDQVEPVQVAGVLAA